MRKCFYCLLFCYTALSSTMALAQDSVEMGIVTGGSKGTYIKIGRDIADLVRRHNIELNVYTSNGSADNIEDVYSRKGVQLGIVQADILAYIKDGQDIEARNIAKKVRLVFPLYNEEIHVVGKNTIKSFTHLDGKRVAIGKEGSGSYLTAAVLFDLAGITPSKSFFVGGADALTMLRNGKIDAMIYVSGYPVSLFKKEIIPNDFHLIPIKDKNILENYVPSEIPSGVYSWQDKDVPTAAVKATLMTYDYQNYHCGTVGQVGKIIYNNINWLRNNGHDKWKKVDLDHKLKEWKRYECVSRALNSNRTNQSTGGKRIKRSLRDSIKSLHQ